MSWRNTSRRCTATVRCSDSSVRLDTDGDGYISCDARVLAQGGVEEKFTVECAATFFNSGCKTKQLLPGIVVPSAR